MSRISMDSLARNLVRYHLPLFLLGLLVTILLVPVANRTRADQSVQSLFDPADTRLQLYQRSTREFGGEHALLAVYHDPEALTPAGLDRLANLREKLASVRHITGATSLADLPHPRDPTLWRDLAKVIVVGSEAALKEGLEGLTRTLAEWRPRSIRDWMKEIPAAERPNLVREIRQTEMYQNVFLGADGETLAILLHLDSNVFALGEVDIAIGDLRKITNSLQPEPARLVGAPVMIGDVHNYLTNDSHRLQWYATLTMLAIIGLLFRNIRWMILPLIVVWSATIWTRAFRAGLDIRQSLIASMTESLITVIGIATVVHVAVFLVEESAKHQSQKLEETLVRTLSRLLGAFGWTSIITAVGFLSVAVSRVRPVREYAILMAGAAIFVAGASLIFLPGGTLLFRRYLPSIPPPSFSERTIAKVLAGIMAFVCRHSTMTAMVVVGIMLLAGVGFSRLQVETEFTRNFRPDAPILDSYNFVENNLGGAGLVEIVADCPSMTPDFLTRLRACSQELQALPLVTKVSSFADVVDFAERLLGSQRLRENSLSAVNPQPLKKDSTGVVAWLSQAVVERSLIQTMNRLPAGQITSLIGSFWNDDLKRVRLLLRVKERQAVEDKARLLKEIESIGKKHLGSSAQPTGIFVMLVFLVDTLVQDQWWAVAASAIGVVILASIAFRSPRLGMIAFAPKLVLVFAVIGTMGWVGLKVNIATAMIGSVSMGLVVAFSVPYLNRFRQEYQDDGNFYRALGAAHGSAGKAMLFANLALALGFLVLANSQFLPTVHFGVLVGVAILGGVVGNLLLLPVLLRLVFWVRQAPPADLEAR